MTEHYIYPRSIWTLSYCLQPVNISQIPRDQTWKPNITKPIVPIVSDYADRDWISHLQSQHSDTVEIRIPLTPQRSLATPVARNHPQNDGRIRQVNIIQELGRYNLGQTLSCRTRKCPPHPRHQTQDAPLKCTNTHRVQNRPPGVPVSVP